MLDPSMIVSADVMSMAQDTPRVK